MLINPWHGVCGVGTGVEGMISMMIKILGEVFSCRIPG